jgi:hypothetical protein
MKTIILITGLFIYSFADAGISKLIFPKPLQVKSYLGQCPSQTAGEFALKIVKKYDETESLKLVKDMIAQEKLTDKYFIGSYNVNFIPHEQQLRINVECALPLMRVQIYKENGIEHYNAILADNGILYDPLYEQLMRNENKITRQLPTLSIPVGEMDKDFQNQLTQLIKNSSITLKNMMSEIILDDKNALTIILSNRTRPISVFMGDEKWSERMIKLTKIIDYMADQKKFPSIVNLTNDKKVVVKFADKH